RVTQSPGGALGRLLQLGHDVGGDRGFRFGTHNVIVRGNDESVKSPASRLSVDWHAPSCNNRPERGDARRSSNEGHTMLTLFGGKQRYCDGISRRSFLQIGALAMGGLTLPALLRAEQRAGRSSHKSVIMVYLTGGLSHHDSFDLK